MHDDINMSLLSEIRKRHVIQVAGVYALVSWFIIQLIDVLNDPLNLPTWLDTVVIVLLVAGVPVTVVLAWLYDITASGIERTRTITSQEISAAAHISSRNSSVDQSIAVMPFKNMSADIDDEYFSDGLTEELINSLAGVQGIQVAARTSSFACKGRNDDIRMIGKQLEVENVLEGSVLLSSGQLRVTVRLFDVSNGNNLWSAKFHQQFDDIFEIQEEIARSIVEALENKLGRSIDRPSLQHGTSEFAAYRHYLQGRYHWNRRTAVGLRSSVQQFKKAIEVDPNYAAAYAGLADSYALSGIAEYGLDEPTVVMPLAKSAALRALKINPASAEAQTTLAHIQGFYDWNWAEAERSFKKAIRLGRNYAFGHHWYAVYLSAMGRHDEAIEEAHVARDLEPLSLIINKNIGMTLYYSQQFGEACDAYREALNLEPAFARTLLYSAMVLNCQGDDDDAIGDIQEALASDPTNGVYAAFLAFTYARSNEQDQAIEIRQGLIERSQSSYVPALNIAIIDLGLREYDRAFDWLDRACEERSSWLVSLRVDPIFAEIKNLPRFQNLLNKIGLN